MLTMEAKGEQKLKLETHQSLLLVMIACLLELEGVAVTTPAGQPIDEMQQGHLLRPEEKPTHSALCKAMGTHDAPTNTHAAECSSLPCVPDTAYPAA
jgi:hypothetical protein